MEQTTGTSTQPSALERFKAHEQQLFIVLGCAALLLLTIVGVCYRF